MYTQNKRSAKDRNMYEDGYEDGFDNEFMKYPDNDSYLRGYYDGKHDLELDNIGPFDSYY